MTVPHYGKRRAGALTAASPGDTLYFQYGSYNDSGDSEAQSGFAVTDIECFKNGVAVARATDSGYSLISDTGQMGDRVGLNRFSISLFNTADDTGFYDNGGWYQVAVDSVTIDGKTVRMWVGSFEIGEPRANVVQIDGDTGPADNLGRIAGDTGSDSYIWRHRDTGGIANAVWTFGGFLTPGFRAVNVPMLNGDTGAASQLQQAFATTPTYFQQVDVQQIDGDTGPADNLGRIAGDTGTGSYIYRESDTGGIADAIWAKTGRTLTSFAFDTGIWGSNAARTLTAFAFDTGIAQTVWRSSTSGFTSDTGSVGYAQGRLMAVKGDTGAAHLDAGRLGVSASATVDTGVINNAIWNGNVSDHVSDTGSFGYAQGRLLAVKGDTGAAHLDAGRLGVNATVSFDTGAVNQAVWQADASRTLTGWAFDTGVQQKLDRYDTGVRSAISQLSNKADTGVPASVWEAATRTLTSAHDTGVLGAIATVDTVVDAIKAQTDKLTFDTGANELHVDIRKVNNIQIQGGGDTGTGNTWRPVA